MRSWVAAGACGALLSFAVATPVLADPAGPTDYRSEVVGIDPPTPTVRADIVGGDSFMELEAEPGTDVVVIGYQGEPYLWFRPDGGVFENRSSPSTYTNVSRYGGGDVPASARADAEPEWKEVGSGHRWTWHDHRIHWMQHSRPLGLGVGDQILEAVVPLIVDGSQVRVEVISVWQPAASTLPIWIGALVGAVLSAGLWALRTRRQRMVLLVPPAVLALVVGVWQFRSLPSETGPRLVWWALPAIATVCAVVATVAALRRREFAARAAALLAGVELLAWGWLRRDGLTAAIIPTNAPGWLDRFSVVLALVVGVGTTAMMLWELFAPGARRAVNSPGSAVSSPAGTSTGASAVPGS
jgi:hypothetical protein